MNNNNNNQLMQNNQKPSPVRLVINPFEVVSYLADGEACGGWDEKFTAAVTLTSEQLDEHGFVVENMSVVNAVRDFFKGRMYKASCENLCEAITNICHSLVGDRLTHAHVKVFNLTGHLELDWHKGDMVPPLPNAVATLLPGHPAMEVQPAPIPSTIHLPAMVPAQLPKAAATVQPEARPLTGVK